MSYTKDTLAREFFGRGYTALMPEHQLFIDDRFAELMTAIADMIQDTADQQGIGGNRQC
jgi:hypothetical protein